MVTFIEGALPFEEVQFNMHRRKNNWEQGVVTTIRRESSQRVKPKSAAIAATAVAKMSRNR